MAVVKILTCEHFDENLPLPNYETKDAAGADIRACLPEKQTLIIPAGKRILIPTGLKFEIEPGFEVQVRPRSGLSLKTGLLVVNSPGTIDADYRGEVKIRIGNFGKEDYLIRHGDRIAQIVLAPISVAIFVEAQELENTERDAGSFGSTGIQ